MEDIVLKVYFRNTNKYKISWGTRYNVTKLCLYNESKSKDNLLVLCMADSCPINAWAPALIIHKHLLLQPT
jgi:hypothetical protein